MLRKGFKRDFLVFLGALGDLAADLSYDTAYKRLYWPDYNPEYISEEISRMVKVKEIEKKIVKGKPVLKITTQGWKILDETIPLRKVSRKKWDGLWRMVIFDIQEENRYLRDRLRGKLKTLGFGRWQRSVYITPHDILREMTEFLQEKKLFPRCVCLETKKVGVGDERKLAATVFKLEELNERYEGVVTDSLKLREKIESGQAEKAEAVAKLGEIWTLYQAVLLADPFLPKELLLKDWSTKEAKAEFSKLARAMRKLKQSTVDK